MVARVVIDSLPRGRHETAPAAAGSRLTGRCLMILKMKGYPTKLLKTKDDQNLPLGYPRMSLKTINLTGLA
jgi:hypothetical protein